MNDAKYVPRASLFWASEADTQKTYLIANCMILGATSDLS